MIQAACRHGNLQLHRLRKSTLNSVFRIRCHLMNQEAVPWIGIISVLCAVQQNLRINMISLLYYNRSFFCVIGKGIPIGKGLLAEYGRIDRIAILILEGNAKFIDQRQDIQNRISCHRSIHGHRGILQIRYSGVESHTSVGNRCCVDSQRPQLCIVNRCQVHSFSFCHRVRLR